MKVTKVHFTGLILGKIYVSAEFNNGVIRHFWLQEPAAWAPQHVYGLGELVQPSVPDGYYYQANTSSPAVPWTAGRSVAIGDVVQPTSPNGWEYVVTDTTGTPTTGETEPAWPTEEGAQVFEGTDSTSVPSSDVSSATAGTPDQISQALRDRYGLGDET